MGSVCGDGSGQKIDPRLFEITLPILTLSEANGILSKTRFIKTGPNKGKPAREHWREAWLRHKAQKEAIHLALSPSRDRFQLPCTVRMTRLGPRELDAEDNLRISLKWIKDAIAEVLTGDMVPGRADSDKRIKWTYSQEKSNQHGVRIIIESNLII